MPDLSQVPHIVHHVAHHAQAVQPAIQPVVQPVVQTIQTGVSVMDSALMAFSAFLVGCGMGWYVKGRGLTGVQIDLDNVKNDVSDLKNKVISLVPVKTQAVETPAPTFHTAPVVAPVTNPVMG